MCSLQETKQKQRKSTTEKRLTAQVFEGLSGETSLFPEAALLQCEQELPEHLRQEVEATCHCGCLSMSLATT